MTNLKLQNSIAYAKKYGYDTIVKCPYCGKTEYLNFEQSLRNGWSKCCLGYTMPIVWQNIDKNKVISNIVRMQSHE